MPASKARADSAHRPRLRRDSRRRKNLTSASKWAPSVETSIRSTFPIAPGRERGLALEPGRGVGLAHSAATRVEQEVLARLRVLDFDEADGRQLLFARVADANRDQVVLPSGQSERRLVAGVEPVADEEDNRPPRQRLVEEIERGLERRAGPPRLVEEDVAQAPAMRAWPPCPAE